jgi:hypothetical protein
LLQSTEPLESGDDVAYRYYRSLKTLKASAVDLIKFFGSLNLIGEMPEKAESLSGNEWRKEPI